MTMAQRGVQVVMVTVATLSRMMTTTATRKYFPSTTVHRLITIRWRWNFQRSQTTYHRLLGMRLLGMRLPPPSYRLRVLSITPRRP